MPVPAFTCTYDFWHASLAGAVPDELYPKLHEPQFGFYRHINGDPVALFPGPDGKTITGLRGFEGKSKRMSVEQCIDVWPSVAAHAVPEAMWKEAFKGNGWPNEAPNIGHNKAPSLDDPEARAKYLTEQLVEWLRSHPKIDSKLLADQGGHYLHEVRLAYKRFEDSIENEKKLYRSFASQVNERGKAVVGPAVAALDTLKQRLHEFMSSTGIEKVGDRGVRASLRRTEAFEIVDRAAVLEHFRNSDEMTELLQRLVNRECKAGKTVPGARRTERESVQ